MKEYKLHKTDGKTYFHFRSDSNSMMESFTVNYLWDGTVVMSGDYGCLVWKRNYASDERGLDYDYAFPDKETNIDYFEEKVQQFGINQKVRKFDRERFIKYVKDCEKEDKKGLERFEEALEGIDEYDEWRHFEAAREAFRDFEFGNRCYAYVSQFEFMFKLLQSVSDQIWDVVKPKEVKA